MHFEATTLVIANYIIGQPPIFGIRQERQARGTCFIAFLHKNIMASEPTEGELQLLGRLDEFVAENSIDLLAFWKTNRLCLTVD